MGDGFLLEIFRHRDFHAGSEAGFLWGLATRTFHQRVGLEWGHLRVFV